MFNVIKNNDTVRELTHQGVRFVLIRRVQDMLNLKDYDGIVIDTLEEVEISEIIQKIRRQEGLQSLVPLFINGFKNATKELICHTDGCVDMNFLDKTIDTTIAINKRLAKINLRKASDFETQMHYKILAYLYSRNEILSPILSRSSRIGYHFSLLSLYFKNNEKGLLKTLDALVSQGVIAKTFKDHIHLCKSCDSTYLNFKEICPSCKSADIRARDMVHHFVCAHVAPESDFITEDGLSCPKCDKQLRHIGIDYDKPSSIFSCNSCTHEFQNPDMQATCFDCETDNSLSELLQKVIGDYSITSQGEQWLFDDRILSQKETNQESIPESGLPLPIFKLLLKQEIKRIATNNVQSTFGSISFSSTQLDVLNADLKKALQEEISEIINSYFVDSDILGIANYNCYYFLLPDTASKRIDRLENIEYNLAKLLNDNLKNETFPVSVNFKLLDANETIEQLFKL